ncbi:hypothetical protein SAMN02799631_05905 [Methylobacterium sp. 174MFSha1.1]|uniref:hypothetical protein n=1 Tax=Methylobacterium sp. 174MFSha1.1 TaxID=1502749 RepID=UPI0008EE0AFF|nr:hypothetical protein [Methylobacterium sp. 174MFSha1.1]SFV14562.1 hypothetical protein SAMN02799631_05905 [Methylobacterium sp. 174MFSha1.1]
MSAIHRRLEKLEATAALHSQPHRVARRFIIQGPHGMSHGDAVAFLREQGHQIRYQDLNIIRCVIGAEDGRPVDLPLEDLTPYQS